MTAAHFAFSYGGGSILADVTVADGVEVQLVRNEEDGAPWEVWAVKIDGVLYREPGHLLVGIHLQDGPFAEALRAAEAQWSETNPVQGRT